MSTAAIEISVALAAYNGSQYIAQQLQSLLNQTRQVDEIIISDDSGNEATYLAVKPFLTDARVRWMRNSGNPGVTGNFENALRQCHGKYIFLCDQDDVWHPDKIKVMADFLDTHTDVDAVFCNSQAVDAQLNPLNFTLWQLRKFSPKKLKKFNNKAALNLCLQRVPISSHNIAFRGEWLKYLLPFPELTPFYPDTFIAIMLASGGRWHAIDRILTSYRIHQSNESSPEGQLLATVRRARRNNAAQRNAQIAELILARLNGRLDPVTVNALQQFTCHHRQRSQYSGNFLHRLLQVACEAASLRYFCYSNGCKTIAADLLFPPGQ